METEGRERFNIFTRLEHSSPGQQLLLQGSKKAMDALALESQVEIQIQRLPDGGNRPAGMRLRYGVLHAALLGSHMRCAVGAATTLARALAIFQPCGDQLRNRTILISGGRLRNLC